jgi:hypothetical protein
MQFQVHVIGKRIAILPLHAPPRVPEGVVALPPALGAWPMPGREGHGFVEEKQLCIAIRGHYDAAPAPEFQNACDPPSALVATDDFPFGVVQCTTAVAQHRAAGGSPEDIAERVNPVLKRHAEGSIMPPQRRRFSLAPTSIYAIRARTPSAFAPRFRLGRPILSVFAPPLKAFLRHLILEAEALQCFTANLIDHGLTFPLHWDIPDRTGQGAPITSSDSN